MSILASDLVAVEYLPRHCSAITIEAVETAISNGLPFIRLGRLRFASGSEILARFPELSERSSING